MTTARGPPSPCDHRDPRSRVSRPLRARAHGLDAPETPERHRATRAPFRAHARARKKSVLAPRAMDFVAGVALWASPPIINSRVLALSCVRRAVRRGRRRDASDDAGDADLPISRGSTSR